MSWVRIDDALPDHPKVLALEDDGLSGFAFYVSAICWSDDHGTDGFLPKLALHRFCPGIEDRAEGQRIAEKLTAVGLFEHADGGYHIHEFTTYQLTKAEKDSLSEKRRIAGRKGGLATQANAQASAKANAQAAASSTDRHTDIHTDKESTRAMRATLPTCLDIESRYTDFPDMTLAQAVLRHADATFGWNGGCAPDRSGLIAVFESGCFPGCKHSEAQARDCASTAIKAIDRCAEKGATTWKRGGRGLFTAVMGDRESMEEAS